MSPLDGFGNVGFFSALLQLMCWAPLRSHAINQSVTRSVTVRDLVWPPGSGCGLTNGPSVVKTI